MPDTIRSSSLADLAPGAFAALKPSERVQEIPVADIRPNPFQVRSEDNFDKKTIKELADSIAKNELMQPVEIRVLSGTALSAVPENDAPKTHLYELVAGERRLRAYRDVLLKETIPAIVRVVPDEKMRLLALLENLQREDLTVMDKANGFAALVSETKRSVESIAAELGIHERTGYLYNRIGCADTHFKDAIRINGLDLHTSDLLISIANIARKGGAKTEREFRELLNTPVDKKTLQTFYEKRYDKLNEFNKTASARKASHPKIYGRMSFWERVRTVEKSIAKHKVVELSEKERNQFSCEAEKFFKAIGAKKVDVKF